MKQSKKNRNIAFMILGVVALVGSYNAVVINSESDLSHMNPGYTKRLDEVYGVTTPGRTIAGTSHWKKLAIEKKEIQKEALPTPVVAKAEAAPVIANPEAAINTELSLNLVEVIHPTKWANGVSADQFNGSITTNNGVIESLNAALPGGENVEVSFSEMTGNVFEYTHNGQNFSGMMYQVDQNAYMVTLTTGPLEGTRLRFTSGSVEEQQQEVHDSLAQNNVEAGSFGQELASEKVQHNEEMVSVESVQSQVFNF